MLIQTVEGYDWTPILTASLVEGHSMVSRLLADFEAGTNRFDLPGEGLFAYTRESIAAVCGLNLEPETCFGEGGRIRRLYVLPAHRQEGLARSLIEEIIGFAGSYHQVLTVNAGTLPARGFYEHIGFQSVSHPNISHIRLLTGDGAPAT
jgi:GNAT superfamily N-acetyltransferase